MQVIKPGDGKTFPQKGQKIKTHYKGTLESNGQEFDSSFKRNKPFEFTIGVGQVITVRFSTAAFPASETRIT
jgi:FK506-binding protein 1